MTLEEKIAFCEGKDFWNTKAVPEEGIESFMLSDGPHGLRKQRDAADMLGLNDSVPAVCFPTAVSTACSWDEELLGKVGKAIGEEARAEGVTVLLGPGANIKRDPTCGRNFEYFSEDPYLAGKLAAAYIRGVQSTGTAACLKHFTANSQEYKRFSSDSIMDERTLREIYLAAFETAVKEGRPKSLMCAYNKLNGVHCSDNKELLTDILRDEWGFDGLVVTDWGAMSSRVKAFEAGCDLCMPGGSDYQMKEAVDAVRGGTLSEEAVDRSVDRIKRIASGRQEPVPCDMEAHHELARIAARESAVLLKNDGGILPVEERSKVVFFGEMAEKVRYQGSGSSHINPYKLRSVTQAAPDIRFTADIKEAKSAKVCVIFAGLTDEYESEGFDRENMKLPEEQDRAVQEIASAGPNTVVVLMSGSPVECPWADAVSAILYVGLSGEAVGEAVCDLLFGDAAPCGKLAESWPYRYEDAVTSGYYAHGRKDAHYREGIYAGYRYYQKAKVPVRWPFGYGLSYSRFEYSGLEISESAVTCTVTNAGPCAGKEIAQLYISPPEDRTYRPERELKGFAKISLEPGESRTVRFELNCRSFAIWDGGWTVPGGKYTIQIGASSEDIRLSGTVEKAETRALANGADAETAFPAHGEKNLPEWYISPHGAPSQEDFEALLGRKIEEKPLKKGGFTMENTVMELKEYSLLMKLIYKGMERVVERSLGGRKKPSDPTFKMMMSSAADCSLSGMKINGRLKNHLLEGLLEIVNGHFLRGIGTMMRKG